MSIASLCQPLRRWHNCSENEHLDIRGFILSGGPASVYDEGAPTCDPAILTSGLPVLGICYGMHLLAHQLGGHVAPATEQREYGPATLEIAQDAAGDAQAYPHFRGSSARQIDPLICLVCECMRIPSG